jgi:hypothetical protein
MELGRREHVQSRPRLTASRARWSPDGKFSPSPARQDLKAAQVWLLTDRARGLRPTDRGGVTDYACARQPAAFVVALIRQCLRRHSDDTA